jgi:hypothetical protein
MGVHGHTGQDLAHFATAPAARADLLLILRDALIPSLRFADRPG